MSYKVQYGAAILVAIIGLLAGVVVTVYAQGGAPRWVTQDVAKTAGMVAMACTGIGALLPQVTRTPADREVKYLKARQGILPPDIHRDLLKRYREHPEPPPH